MEYKIDVSEIEENRDEKIVKENTIHIEPMKVAGTKVELENPVSFRVTLTNVGSGILAEGRSWGIAKMVCSRCLDDFIYQVESNQSELFRFEAPSTEEDIEERVYHVIGSKIDIYPMIRDSLGLALPTKPLCRRDCKGLCQVCGANFNLERCEHQAKER